MEIAAKSLDVTAYSDYKLTGASAAVSGGQIAGAVNGLVNVVKASTLAEMEGNATLENAASVKTRSVRDIVNVAATVGAGQTGVGFTVMALIAGDRMDEDTADMLTYGSAENKDGDKTFDAGAMVTSLKDLGVDTSSLEERKDEKGNVTQTSLADDLTGNGQRMSDTRIGNGEKFDAASGSVSDDLYQGGDGANAQFRQTDDIQQAKDVGGSAYTEDPKDAVNARIGGNAVISAKGVTVQAEQQTLADLYGATVGAGAATGVGISFSAAILRSNVFATSLGTIDAHEEEVKVNAVSHTGDITPEAGSSEEQRMKSVIESLGDTLKLTKRSIRTIGLAVGGAGTAAVAVTAGIVRLDNITNATMGGTVTNAGKVTVNADSKYGNVLAATLAATGSGELAVSGSIAATAMHGTTRARLDGTADISGKKPEVSVTTNSWLKGNTAAAAVAASGAATAAAGLAVVINDLKQDTVVERGAHIKSTDGDGSMTVKGNADIGTNAYLFTFDVGMVGFGLSAAYANVKPTLNTTVGIDGKGTTNLEGMGRVDILNDIKSQADSNLLSASAGLGSILGSVMLVFNDTVATAKAGSISGQVNGLNINSSLKADNNSKVSIISGGAGALGVSVNYVDVHSQNTAELDTDDLTAKLNNLWISTGDQDKTYTTSANAESMAGIAGGIAGGVNTAIAHNRAQNYATLNGKSELNVSRLIMNAWGAGNSSAKLSGLSIGAADVMASVVSAVNEATNSITMHVGGLSDTEALNVSSDLSGTTNAVLETGAGSLLGIDVNVATAYGRTTSQIDLEVAKATTRAITVNIGNNGADDVNTSIDNLNYSLLNVATMVGVAHSQDDYSTKLALLDGEYDVQGLDVRTNYNTNTQSAVTPSAAGIKISGSTVDVNYASATNTSTATSELALNKAAIKTDKDVNVYTRGNAGVTSWINPASFQLDMSIGVGVNVAKADLATTQAATLRLEDSSVDTKSRINVKSIADKSDALAVISTSGTGKDGKDRLHISLVNYDKNKAVSMERFNSTASILGGGVDDSLLKAQSLSVYSGVASDVQTSTAARTDGSEGIGLTTVGNLDGDASSADSFKVTVKGFTADIGDDANLTAKSDTISEGTGYSPGTYHLVQLFKVDIGHVLTENRQAHESKAQFVRHDGFLLNAVYKRPCGWRRSRRRRSASRCR